ncbi:MAG: hypothetical protein ABI614_28930, partial [Planctomycetota bacterium]
MSNKRRRRRLRISTLTAVLLAVAYLLCSCQCEGQEPAEHRHSAEDVRQDQRPEAIPPSVHLAPETDGSLNSLRLDDFEGMALANNPTLAQATAQASAARGGAYQAGLPFNPVIG